MTSIEAMNDLCRKGWNIKVWRNGLNSLTAVAFRRDFESVETDHPDPDKLLPALHDKVHEKGFYANGGRYGDD